MERIVLPAECCCYYLCSGVRGHSDEVLDVSFDSTGQRLVTASADGGVAVFVRQLLLFTY